MGELVSQLRVLEADAARYHWLRAGNIWRLNYNTKCYSIPKFPVGSSLDQQIDTLRGNI